MLKSRKRWSHAVSFTQSLLLLPVLILLCANFNPVVATNSRTPPIVNIGALVAFKSTVGRATKQAIELAVREVNRNRHLLSGTKLLLHMLDTDCNTVQAAVAALELQRKEAVAIVQGPQPFAISRLVAEIAGDTQVPVVSFGAKGSTILARRYPYFLSVGHSEAMQIAAVLAVIDYYKWTEVVVLYTDDEFQINGITLSGALTNVGGKNIEKKALLPGINKATISSVLTDLAGASSRVFLVHMHRNDGLRLLSEASNLGMISEGYVWIVTDSIAATLDDPNLNPDFVDSMQGIIGVRPHIPKHSSGIKSFLLERRRFQGHVANLSQFNVNEFYAYESVWLIARAVGIYLRMNQRFSFKQRITPLRKAGVISELALSKVLDGGPLLREKILQQRMAGTTDPTSQLQVKESQNPMASEFEIVNMVGKTTRVIGYWTKETGLSLTPPVHGRPASNVPSVAKIKRDEKELRSVIWPGDSVATPRGRILSQDNTHLRIFVPNKTGFTEFLSVSDYPKVMGYCIEVFEKAVSYLPYNISYTVKPYEIKIPSPTYDDMIRSLANKSADAAVGDVTITAERMEIVSFTQPYTESGIAVVVPAVRQHSRAWAFLRPFTPSMWSAIVASFVFTGIVVWMLEHKENRDFRGHPRRQMATTLWFITSTLFFSQRERIRSSLGRLVVIVWLFVVLVITASYTASLTSILTVEQLSPVIQDVSSLKQGNDPLGYQTGSFVKDYLIEQLHISEKRLVALATAEEYANALTLGPKNSGGVAAIFDELPYIQLFLARYCGFIIAGTQLTKGGFGFAFPKDSKLAVDFSIAFLNMSGSGELQKIHDAWLKADACNVVQSTQLSLESFWGLFLVTGGASMVCLVIYISWLLWEFVQKSGSEGSVSSVVMMGGGSRNSRRFSSRSAKFVRSFAAYIDEASDAGDKSESRKRKKQARIAPAMADQTFEGADAVPSSPCMHKDAASELSPSTETWVQ